jgi:serine/threonine protein kinase
MSLIIPGYRIERVLGKGGMATVYLAVQEIFERQVALKIMSSSLAEDPSFGQRFMREARIVSHLTHPNIITVFDVGVHLNVYYLSMEYIAGPDLKQARQSLSFRQKVQVICDIANALDFANSRGYVHRDIKPENILLRPESWQAVLMDFGIARTADGDLNVTQTGMALGTPHYMSPEQAKGLAVDHRSDLYSLGVVFYYLLTGEVPYHADSAVAIGVKHITDPIPRLPIYLQDLQKIIDRLMAKKPQDRYATAKDLLVDIAALDMDELEKSARQLHDYPHVSEASDSQQITHLQASSLANKSISFITQTNSRISSFLLKLSQLRWFALAVGMVCLVLSVGIWQFLLRDYKANPGPTTHGSSVNKKNSDPSGAAIERNMSNTVARKNDAANTYGSGEPKTIRLRDIADPEYREVASDEPKAQSRPLELLQRFKQRVQNAAGQANRQEMTLEEKIAELRRKLANQPNDRQSLSALEQLSTHYFTKAQDFFSRGDFISAQHALERSFSLFPESKDSQTLLVDRLENRQKLESLLTSAHEAFLAENWISPWRRNAIFYYQKALDIDNQLIIARKGIAKVAKSLMARARTEYAAGNWEQAAETAESVLEFSPEFKDAKQFLFKLEQRSLTRDDASPNKSDSVSLSDGQPLQGDLKQLNDGGESLPVVTQVRMDGKLISGIHAPDDQRIPAQKILFVSFEYANFPLNSADLQVELQDSSGKGLARVSVRMDETQGIQRFRFEEQTGSFAPGEYHILFWLNGKKLLGERFLLE